MWSHESQEHFLQRPVVKEASQAPFVHLGDQPPRVAFDAFPPQGRREEVHPTQLSPHFSPYHVPELNNSPNSMSDQSCSLERLPLGEFDLAQMPEGREDTPPTFVNMHWVPDDILKELNLENSWESSYRPAVVSVSNDSYSYSFNDTPDLIDTMTPSFSARRSCHSLSLSPHLPPASGARINLSPAPYVSPAVKRSCSPEFVSHRSPRTLADFIEMGIVGECARDESMSRLLQKEIRYADRADRQRALDQILQDIVSLSRDCSGNYVIQKMIEHGHPEHRSQICEAIMEDIWGLTQDAFGCRVVQKVIEYGDIPSKVMVFEHLLPHMDECIADDNGNYVVQKLIGELPAHLLEPIHDVLQGRVEYFCTHPYGCRIVQRLLDHAEPSFTKRLCDEILVRASKLAKHAWGNYVIQYILESCKPEIVSTLTKILLVDMGELARDQLASNVMEKCITLANGAMVGQLFKEFLNRSNDDLVQMMNHKYGNFVAGTLIQKCDSKRVYNKLYKRMKRFNLIRDVKDSHYGRHVWIKMDEKLRKY